MANKRCYEPEDLKKVQAVLLDILAEVIRICEKNNLTLFMEGGTAIGAVRHNGFIPWDDDVDVFLMRDEYEKLMKLLPEELGEAYGTDNWVDNNDFPAPNACVYAKNTLMQPIEMKKYKKYEYGISIGIYPYDNIPDDDKVAKRQLRKCWILARLNWLKIMPFPYVSYRGFKKFIVYAMCAVAFVLLKPIPRKWIINTFEKIARSYNDTETKRATITFSNKIFRTNINKDELFPAKTFKFESIEVKLPACYHELLTREYGDYMQLPPEDQRKNHYPESLKFADEE